MRRQFVLDKQSDALLGRLAASRAGNRSYVIREAISLYASMEDRLETIEASPAFQKRMRQSAAEIESGRTLTHAQVAAKLKASTRRAARSIARSRR
jgi:predicted transcriptional regulator